MEVQRVVIHRIGKESGMQGEEVRPPAIEAAVLQYQTVFLTQFVENIRTVFNSSGTSVWGRFHVNTVEFPFSSYLRSFLENANDTTFLHFCQQSTLRLYHKIRDIYLAKVDFAIYIQYEEGEEIFFFVVILNNIDSALVGPDGQLTSAPTLDINKLHHAGRININKWLGNNPGNYLSFISKRESGVSGSGYFRNFLGGDQYNDADEITRNLKATIKSFSADNNIDTNVIMRETFDYLMERINTDITLSHLANRIFPDCADAFLRYAHTREVPGEFKPSRKEVKRFQKLSIRNGNEYSINLDRDLFGNTVCWEPHQRSLTIRVAASDAEKIDNFLSENGN